MNTKVQFINYYNDVEIVNTEIYVNTTPDEAVEFLKLAGWKISTDIPFATILSKFDGSDSRVDVIK